MLKLCFWIFFLIYGFSGVIGVKDNTTFDARPSYQYMDTQIDLTQLTMGCGGVGLQGSCPRSSHLQMLKLIVLYILSCCYSFIKYLSIQWLTLLFIYPHFLTPPILLTGAVNSRLFFSIFVSP